MTCLNDKQLICELSADGMPIELIAEKMEVTLSEALTTLHESGVEFTNSGSMESIVIELLKQGLTAKRVVEITDFNRSTVMQAKRKAGMSRRVPRCEYSFAQRYKMAVSLIADGLTVTEACRNVRLSSRDYVAQKNAPVIS